MPIKHCRECTALGSRACDCAQLLAGRSGYDAVAKPLLHSVLGEKWMGMEDMSQTTEQRWESVRVSKINRELSHEEERLPGLERDVSECKARIGILKRDKEAELAYEADGG